MSILSSKSVVKEKKGANKTTLGFDSEILLSQRTPSGSKFTGYAIGKPQTSQRKSCAHKKSIGNIVWQTSGMKPRIADSLLWYRIAGGCSGHNKISRPMSILYLRGSSYGKARRINHKDMCYLWNSPANVRSG